jgi:hypothetical protein
VTTDHPRQQLHYIITHYGRSICDDPKRCEALLKDLCPQNKREVFLLVWALREGIAKELLTQNQLLPIETVISRLSQKLYDELGFDSDLAQWAVGSWALVLGIKFNSIAIAPSLNKGKVMLASPEVAMPTTPINHAVALQQIKQQQTQIHSTQAIIDQFKGWKKIGLRGEKLAVDSPQWAAVVDEETKLMWAVNPSKTADFPNPKEKMTWDEAQAWVKYVNRGGCCGYKNWRLPTIDELKTLITYGMQGDLYIRADIFTDINTDNGYRVWSSSPFANSSGTWIVSFGYSDFNRNIMGVNYYVRLVRSCQ